MLKVLTAVCLSVSAVAAQAVTLVTVEAAGVQSTSVALARSGVETFDQLPTGYKYDFSTTFGTSELTGEYLGDSFVVNANDYGGAGGTGSYYSVSGSVALTITSGVADYFGLWASALDGGNSIAFYMAGVMKDTIDLADYVLADTYLGNPNGGGDNNEKFAFFNFNVIGGYDKVVLIQNNGGGFENDNHTVGLLAAVPEPASWALMIAGFGMTGLSMRRRKVLLAA